MASTKKQKTRGRRRGGGRPAGRRVGATDPLTQTVHDAITVAAKHQIAGRYSLAAELYAHVLSVAPEHPDAWHLAGVLAYQQRDHAKALEFISHAIELAPDRAHFYINLSNVWCAVSQPQQAVEACREALKLEPHSSLAWSNLGNAYKALDRMDDAIKAYKIAIDHTPNFYDAYINLGSAYLKTGEPQLAEQTFRNALSIDAQRLEARSNLGLALGRNGDLPGAVQQFVETLADYPDQRTLVRNLRNGLCDFGDLRVAQRAFRTALPSVGAPIQGLLTASISPVLPSSNDQITDYRHQLHSDLVALTNSRLIEHADELAVNFITPPFYLPYQGLDDRKIKEAFAAACHSSKLEPLHQRTDLTKRRKDRGRVKVGFPVGSERHTVFLRFMQGLINQLAQRDDIELMVASPVSGIPALRQKLDERVELVPLAAEPTVSAQALAEQACDLLYYFEIGTESLTYFLPFFGAAPVQATSWGTPVTSGIPQIDYFLSSQLIEPADAQDHYSEKLHLMETLPVVYERPAIRPIAKSREAFGFSPQDHLIGVLQSPYKLHPDFDSVIADILRSDERAQVALAIGTYANSQSLLTERLQRNLPDVASRVTLLPKLSQDDFHDFARHCDVVLDTLHFGGGATAYECLAMGVPVLTLPGKFMRGRVTQGCYQKMGITDCIASSRDDFVAKAVALAADPARQQALRESIVERNEVLFRDPTAVDEFAEFLSVACSQLTESLP